MSHAEIVAVVLALMAKNDYCQEKMFGVNKPA